MEDDEKNENKLTIHSIMTHLTAMSKRLASIEAKLDAGHAGVFDNTSENKFLRIEETAKALRLSTKSIRRMIDKGELRAHRKPGGRSIRLRRDEVQTLLKRDPDRMAR